MLAQLIQYKWSNRGLPQASWKKAITRYELNIWNFYGLPNDFQSWLHLLCKTWRNFKILLIFKKSHCDRIYILDIHLLYRVKAKTNKVVTPVLSTWHFTLLIWIPRCITCMWHSFFKGPAFKCSSCDTSLCFYGCHMAWNVA